MDNFYADVVEGAGNQIIISNTGEPVFSGLDTHGKGLERQGEVQRGHTKHQFLMRHLILWKMGKCGVEVLCLSVLM